MKFAIRSVTTRFSFNMGNYEEMKKHLDIKWKERNDPLESVEKWEYIKHAITGQMEQHIPKRQSNTRLKKIQLL